MQRPHPGCPPRARKPCPRRQIGPGPAGGDALILGAVIAGGRSSRFGSDKAEALLDGKPLVEHAAAAIRPHVSEIVLVGRERDGWTSLPDRPRPGLGPLGGIAAALLYGKTHGHDRVLTIGCDMPHIPAELIGALIARTSAYCCDAPILGCWPASTIKSLDRHLSALAEAGSQFDGSIGLPPSRQHEHGAKDPRLSIRRWASSIAAQPIAAPTPIANVNTPADLARFASLPPGSP
ncbi:MAG TPA: molybdenum cofactor guanylyltransferase [Sphingomonas sp.]|nr:molybdenum cofactor guanylyltransferase [Sphingomonas sp.]